MAVNEDTEAILETIFEVCQSTRTGINRQDPVNLVEVLAHISETGRQIADAITPTSAMPGNDATGGSIRSLTESMMGVTAGLCQIAEAINNLAEATRESNDLTATLHKSASTIQMPSPAKTIRNRKKS